MIANTPPERSAGGLDLPGPIGFVLSGGASLGAVQVGMLQALASAGVHPDFIVGTSVGALNGAILAAHPDDGVDRLTETWLEMQRSDVFPGNLLSSIWRLGRTRTHAVGTEGLERIAARALQVDTFGGLRIPLGVVTVDLTLGETVVFESGPLVPALLASSAIPGVFPPVSMDGHLFVDGAMLADIAVSQARDFHLAGTLIVLDCVVPPPRGTRESLADVVAVTSKLQYRAQLRAALRDVEDELPIVCMPAPPARKVSPFDFRQTAQLMDDARQAGQLFLDSLTVRGPGLYGDPFSRYLSNLPQTTEQTTEQTSVRTR